jgi:HPt (histidine-containing phosphotransfer) domain-containing protein
VSDFDARYQALRARFVQRCREDLPIIERAAAGEAVDPEALRMTVHRLSGAAGTFGYPELSGLAGAVDDELIERGEAGPRAIAALVEAVRALVG